MGEDVILKITENQGGVKKRGQTWTLKFELNVMFKEKSYGLLVGVWECYNIQ